MGRPSDARQRLIETAARLIFANSYASISVDELCAAAGVTKSSFYHFFSSKQQLTLAALELFQQHFQQNFIEQAFLPDVPVPERVLRLFDLTFAAQYRAWEATGHMPGCPGGNLTLEMSTQDELLRSKVESIFSGWAKHIEHVLREALEQGMLPATADPAMTAQALLAYFEGVLLLAKGRNDPTLIRQLRTGALALIQGE